MNGSNFDHLSGPDPKRLLIAVLSVSFLFMLYSYFFTPAPVSIPNAPEIKKTQIENLEEKKPDKQAAYSKATPGLSLIKSEFIFLDDKNDKKQRTSYRIETSNFGGLISNFLLMDFSEPKVLISPDRQDEFLALESKNAEVTLTSTSPYEIVEKSDHGIVYRHITKEGLSIERKYDFKSKATIDETITLKNLSKNPQKLELSLLLKKEALIKESSSFLFPSAEGMPNVLFKSGETFKKYSFKDISKESKVITNPMYFGFDDQYFLDAFVPKEKALFYEVKLSGKEIDKNNFLGQAEALLKPIILMPNEAKNISHQLFLGPKQVDLLSSFVPPLEDNVEFGWLSVLCRPMLWCLVFINNFVNNFGWAIILLTLLIKLLTYPLTSKSFSSQVEMKKIAPKIKDLQKKYSHDRSLLGQKQMELYREHGINPLAGCLPLLIQLPIWFALYRMLGFSVELYDQPFFGWIHDLTKADPYYILPVTMGISMLLTQILMPPQVDQPEMKYVLWGMPIFFTFIMLNLPAGLSLYILTNNVLTIAQQLYLKRRLDDG